MHSQHTRFTVPRSIVQQLGWWLYEKSPSWGTFGEEHLSFLSSLIHHCKAGEPIVGHFPCKMCGHLKKQVFILNPYVPLCHYLIAHQGESQLITDKTVSRQIILAVRAEYEQANLPYPLELWVILHGWRQRPRSSSEGLPWRTFAEQQHCLHCIIVFIKYFMNSLS